VDVRRAAGWLLFAMGVVSSAFVVLSVATIGDAFRLGTGVLLGLVVGLGSLLLVASLPLALLLIGWRLAHPKPMPPVVEPRTHRAPVRPVEEADVANVRMPVRVCPDCGYLGIRMPTIGDGLWPGGGETGDRMVCPRCDWQGLPVSFESREDYVEFLRAIQPASNA
jgi:hypothetical protein